MDFDDGMTRITSYQDFIKITQNFSACTIVAYKVNSRSPFYSQKTSRVSSDKKIIKPMESFLSPMDYGLIWGTGILNLCEFSKGTHDYRLLWYEFISLQNSDVPKKIATLKQCGIENQMNGVNWFIFNEAVQKPINENVCILSAQDDLQMRTLHFEDAKFLLDSLMCNKCKFPMDHQNKMAIKILKDIYRNQSGLDYDAKPQKIA